MGADCGCRTAIKDMVNDNREISLTIFYIGAVLRSVYGFIECG
jgi:hypothetical protein